MIPQQASLIRRTTCGSVVVGVQVCTFFVMMS
jgi:hypothetical protein